MIPEALIQAQSQSEDGRRWLDSLPVLIEQLCARWELGTPRFIDADGSCSWIGQATRQTGDNVIIKIGMPHMESRDEAAGLTLWNQASKASTVTLYEYDASANAMLLEPCIPGVSLRTLAEDQQDEIICKSLVQLWKVGANDALASGIRDLGDMLRFWGACARARHANGPYQQLIEKGCDVFQAMLDSTTDKCLLATDLHAGNILSSTRSPWLLIDPKPFVGDPAYDLTQHILNCQTRLHADPLSLVRRLAVLSGCDAGRIAQWLAARLMIEDGITEQKTDIVDVLLRTDFD